MALLTAEDLLNTPQGLEWKLVHYAKSRLESTRKSSIILAAFSFSVFSSFQITLPTECPRWIYTILSINSAILVVMHSFSFMISTFLLPKLEAVIEEYKPPEDGDLFIKKVPAFSPHEKFSGFVGLSYRSAHTIGLFLFLIEIVLISWVKFYDYSIGACLASSIVMIPFLLVFAIFCIYFHRLLNQNVYQTRSNLLYDVEKEFSKDILNNLAPPPPPLSDIKKLSTNLSDSSFDDTASYYIARNSMTHSESYDSNLGFYNKGYRHE